MRSRSVPVLISKFKSLNKKKKICLVGDFSVGKTSLTQKFVNDVFSEEYLTTIGVKIDTAEVGDTKLVVWDVAGRDSLSSINSNYLVGASGVILVADGSRPRTLTDLNEIWRIVEQRIGDVPAVVALNKSDLEEFQVGLTQVEQQAEQTGASIIHQKGWPVLHTSAKDGSNVSELFETLVTLI